MGIIAASAIGAAMLANAVGLQAQPGSAKADCDLACTIEHHMQAGQDHDIGAFAATVTQRPEARLILPNGLMIDGRDSYLAGMSRLFETGGFEMHYDILDLREGADLGYALLDVTFTFEQPARTERTYVVLVLAREDGMWRVFHDQNTAVPPADNEGGPPDNG